MNFFYLDKDPKKCAISHFDTHVKKMVIEYTQLLSTGHRLLDGKMYIETVLCENGRTFNIKRWKLDDWRENVFYKATHYNHPVACWVRYSSSNYKLMYAVLGFLHEEYKRRFGKYNASFELFHKLKEPPKNCMDDVLYDPPKCVPDHYHDLNVIDAYRSYYRNEKRRLCAYTNREQPTWY